MMFLNSEKELATQMKGETSFSVTKVVMQCHDILEKAEISFQLQK